MRLEEALRRVGPLNHDAIEEARHRWDSVAKPLGSLGRLEELIVQIAGITGGAVPRLSEKAVVVFCADNGVVAEGVTQSGQEITAMMAGGLARGDTSVCRMAAVAGASVIPVDIGISRPVEAEGLLQRSVRRGTENLAQAPAMTREEAIAALETGIALAGECKANGLHILAAGEMGIGNTTTSSAVIAALLGLPAAQVTGRGAGLSTQGLERKIHVIDQAIALHRPDPQDGVDVLAKVGGLDLAGIAGLFLGSAVYRIPVIMDGLISAAAALAAVRICPAVGAYLIPSHQSDEPATALVMEALGLHPILHAGMRLGEGTGAVALMPLLDMAMAVYREAPTFSQRSMDAYQKLT